MRAAAAYNGPVFLRLSRMPVPDVHAANYEFRIGHAACLRHGGDVTIVANGTMVCRALEAASILQADGIGAAVINMSCVRPLDRDAIVEAAGRGPIVTVEEHSVAGGLGSAVAECVVQSRPAPMRILGIPDQFAPTGSAAFLFEHFGLTAEGIAKAAMELVEESAGVAREAHSSR